MEQGLTHLYWGDGKGKTTAAMGLALRALGSGKRVVIVQFLKGRATGEVPMLELLGAVIYRGKGVSKFVSEMDAGEKAEARQLQTEHLRQAIDQNAEFLILDEACAAWQQDMVDRELLRQAVLKKPEGQELVLTGRVPADWMLAAADYSTEMRCCVHPYERGVQARKGVEF